MGAVSYRRMAAHRPPLTRLARVWLGPGESSLNICTRLDRLELPEPAAAVHEAFIRAWAAEHVRSDNALFGRILTEWLTERGYLS